MKIYFAGDIMPPREEMILKYKVHRLFSYYFHGKGKKFYSEFKLRLDHIKNEKQ
jgi:hypothetical protein